MHPLDPERRILGRFFAFALTGFLAWPFYVLALYTAICWVKAPLWVDYLFWPHAALVGVAIVLGAIVYAKLGDGR